jgi:hypothetical protein
MMTSYSTAAYMVDWLQSRADQLPTETEIESMGVMSPEPTKPTVRRSVLNSWLQRLGWKASGLPTALTAGGKV